MSTETTAARGLSVTRPRGSSTELPPAVASSPPPRTLSGCRPLVSSSRLPYAISRSNCGPLLHTPLPSPAPPLVPPTRPRAPPSSPTPAPPRPPCLPCRRQPQTPPRAPPTSRPTARSSFDSPSYPHSLLSVSAALFRSAPINLCRSASSQRHHQPRPPGPSNATPGSWRAKLAASIDVMLLSGCSMKCLACRGTVPDVAASLHNGACRILWEGRS